MTYSLIIKSPNWETILFVETTELLVSNCARAYRYIVRSSNFICWGGAFDSLYRPKGRVFVQNDSPGGRRALLTSSRVSRVCLGGDGYG